MQITTRAIVFSSLKYGDSSLIVKAFTFSDGLKTYLLKGILTSRKGKLKTAYFQPLTQLELVVNHRHKGSMEHIREARISYPYGSLHTDMVKKSISLFLAEVLSNSIREEEQNKGLFQFLEASLQWLDTHDRTGNFHIFFLMELSKYLGFYPDISGKELPYFDLVEGSFVPALPLSPSLSGVQLSHFRAFLGINFDDIESIKLGKDHRKELLQSLLQYFEVHLHGFRKPRSLAILNEVFS